VDPSLFFLGHRGISHTVWGAPLMGVALWFLLSRSFVVHRWRWAEGFAFDRASVTVAAATGLSHVFLDWITITGVPWLWPVTTERASLSFFFFLLPTMAVAASVVWIQVLRRRGTRRTVLVGAAVVLAFLALSGGIRAASYPYERPDGATVVPGFADWRWTVVVRDESGVQVYSDGWGGPQAPHYFQEPNRTVAADAIDACRRLVDHTAWTWETLGPAVVGSTGRAGGGWNVTFADSVMLYANATGDLGFRFREGADAADDAFHCEVDAAGRARPAGRG
jgi:hypothetical protein